MHTILYVLRRLLAGFLALLLPFGNGPAMTTHTVATLSAEVVGMENTGDETADDEASDTPDGMENEDSTEDGEVPEAPEEADHDADSGETEPVYEDGVIRIYSYEQLVLIGSGQPLTTQDADPELIGLGEPVIAEDETEITYSPDGVYTLVREIPLPSGSVWRLPEGFEGQIAPVSPCEEQPLPLYDDENDAIYIYHPYQLALLMAEDAADQPVLTEDYAPERLGVGQLIYPDGEEGGYLTYSPENRYILSTRFCSDVSELPTAGELMSVDAAAAVAVEDEARVDLYGRDFPGQVIKKINGKTYILIGNEAQLRAIGSGKEVYTPAYQAKYDALRVKHVLDTDKNGNNIMLYGGDADYQIEDNGLVDTQFRTLNDFQKLSGVIYYATGVDQETGEIRVGTLAEVDDTYKTGVTYAANANYIIFRDIDLSGGNWEPLAFNGYMVGAKAEQDEKLWDENGLTATGRPVISHITVEQKTSRNANDARGVGFFSTITNEMESGSLSSLRTAYVGNLELADISVSNFATKVENNETLLNGLLSGVGALLGGLLDGLTWLITFGQVKLNLRDLLSDLLNARAKDPTFYATGVFAGVVNGDVRIEDCVVSDATVSNASNYTGGFVGYAEGTTQYLLGPLKDVLDLLSSILNVIPFLGLGDLITILGDALGLDKLIITGYTNPVIHECTLSALSGTVGTADKDFAGGFIGAQMGTVVEDCEVINSTYSVAVKNYGGGFAGLVRDGEMAGTLTGVTGDDFSGLPSVQQQSILLRCGIRNSKVAVSGENQLGGYAGAMANSYAVDCAISGDSVRVNASGNCAGGFAGTATLGWSVGLGSGETKDSNLLKVVNDLLTGLLNNPDAPGGTKLLALVGISPSAILGCQVDCGSVAVSAGKGGYAGGMVGKGDGLILADSSPENLNKLTYWEHGVYPAPADREKWPNCSLSGLTGVTVTGDAGYAGGLVGFAGTASVGGLLDSTVGLARFIGFTVENAIVVGAEGGYTVHADGDYAGGGFGFAMGGEIKSVSLRDLGAVKAHNHAGGFAGCVGPGDLAGTSGLTLNLLGLQILSLKNLLSLGQGIEVRITDSDVMGIQEGYTVEAFGENEPGGVTRFAAAGFVASSNSTEIIDSHASNLYSVTAADVDGYAGGFIGISETGGLADVADEEQIIKLIEADGLLDAVGYLIPNYKNCTVTYVNDGYVRSDVAGGFVADLRSGTVDNSTYEIEEKSSPYAVYDIDRVIGRTYGGGFGGVLCSGALADAGGGLSVLGGLANLNINISDLLSLVEAYVPYISYAGVYSEDGFTVEAKGLQDGDTNSGSAGGFAGYTSGAQISHCDVNRLKHTEVTPPNDLEAVNAPTYFRAENSAYAVTGGRYAGGFVGDMDIGSAASVGKGLEVLGSSIALTDVLSALSVVVTTIEHSDVYGCPGGYAILASANENDNTVGMAGGLAGRIAGGHIQNSNAHNFSYIIGQESAGGYVGSMLPGNAANVLNETTILGGLVNTDTALASLVEDFVPTIRNSSTDCIPCGGAVRADAYSTAGHQRGMAGGYVGHNEGGHIWGLNTDTWRDQNDGVMPGSGTQTGNAEIGSYTGPVSVCKAIRIRSVYGYEYAGGYTGYMECADTAQAGGLSLLGNLVTVDNLLGALSVVYPTQENTEVNGPLSDMDIDTWNTWVKYVGKYGGYGLELAKSGTVTTQEELDGKLAQFTYGYHVVAGRGAYHNGVNIPTSGGDAGGYVGRMSSGVITNALAKDAKFVQAMGNAGGFAGQMLTGGITSFGGVTLFGGAIDLNLGKLLSLGELFVPVVKSGSVQGYTSGLTVKATGNDITNRFGYAGGYVGGAYGGQIWGEEGIGSGCNVTNLRRVQADLASGGFAGLATAASVADVNTNAGSGFLQDVLDALISAPGDLASVLQATMTTIRTAKVTPADTRWGFVVEGYSRRYATYAGGFGGMLEASVIGKKDTETMGASVSGLRSVEGGLYAGGFFGLADVNSVASISGTTNEEGQDKTGVLLDLIKLGNTDVLDAFRTYVYHSSVSGVEEGITVTAHETGSTGMFGEGRERGCAGGFGGGLLNGSVYNCTVMGVNTVTAPNYSGGFVGHLGKSGVVDLDDADVLGLLGATAGVLDVFGSHVENSTLSGVHRGYVVNAAGGSEPIAGGFAGYADLSRLIGNSATNAKLVYSDEIAGGFVGKTTMSYLVNVEAGNSPLVQPLLYVVNELVKALYLDKAQDVGLINVDIPGLNKVLALKIFADGDLLYVNLLGIKISASLSRKEDTGAQTDVAKVTIGDSKIELKCDESGILDGEGEKVKISLIKGNRTKVDHCFIKGIANGYDVYGGGAGNDLDGSSEKGYAGGFVGYNREGHLTENNMYYCDVVRGTSGKIGPFSGCSSIDSVYDWNTLKSIEGENNVYRIYRVTDTPITEAKLQNGTVVAAGTDDHETAAAYRRFDVTHLAVVNEYSEWQGAYMSAGDGTQLPLNVYESGAKAVLMRDISSRPNDQSLVPEPGENLNPCEEQISITIQKIWRDWNDMDKIRPDSICVRIWQLAWDEQGNPILDENGKQIKTLYKEIFGIATDEDGWFTIQKGERDTPAAWTYVVNGLPVAEGTSDSEEGSYTYYTYEVEEKAVDGYATSIAYDSTGLRAVITNTHQSALPITGGIGDVCFTMGGLSLLLLSGALRKRRGRVCGKRCREGRRIP